MEVKERIAENMARLRELSALVDIMPLPFRAYIPRSDSRLVIEVQSMTELAEARHILRESLGKWTDKLTIVWESLGRGLAGYDSEDFPIELRLCTPLAKFPKEIGGENCRFVERTETRYSYVCEAPGGTE